MAVFPFCFLCLMPLFVRLLFYVGLLLMFLSHLTFFQFRFCFACVLTLSWRKSMDWFLSDIGFCLERVNISEYKVFPVFSSGKSFCSSWTLVWLVLLGLCFKLLYFLNFRCCETFLIESPFAFVSVWMAWYWFWPAFLFRELSVFLMSYAVSPILLAQNCTMSFINDSKNCFCFEYQLSKNSWSWLPIVGSSPTLSPLGTSFSATQRVKNCLWDTNLACLSFKRLSFIARYIVFLSFCFSVKSKSLFTSRFFFC